MGYGTGMLQLNKAQSTTGREPAEHEIVSGAESLQSFVGFVRRQFPAIAFMTFLAIALGAIYLVTARPSFTAQAQLLIDAHKVQMFQQQSILGDIPIDTAQVESQIEVLKSENIASAVIKNLHLTDDPEFVGSGGGLMGALFNFGFASILFGSDQDQVASEFEHKRQAIRTFQDLLSVKRIGLSYVIQIGFRSSSPEKSAQIANAVADAYIVDQLEAKYQATRRAGAWLQDRIKELREQVSAAERAVVEFKTKNNIVSTGGTDKPLLNQQEVAELSSQLVLARAHSAEAKARLDRISAVLTSDSPNESFGATVADTLKSDVVSKLRSQYLDLAARESDWSAKYGQNHIAVVNLRNQMREIRNSIFQELKRLGETYKSDYEIAKQREEGVQKELAQAVAQSQQTDVKSVALRELQSTAQTYKTLYDNFLQRYMESVQQQSFPITEARVISSASRPLTKSNPKTLLVLAVASLGGLIFGFGIGMVRDLSDRVFRTGDQIENLLQAECIGLVPLLTSDDVSGASNSSKAKVDPGQPNPTVNSIFARIVEIISSFSLVSDLQGTYKSTKRSLDTFGASFSPKEYSVAELSMKPKKAHAAQGQRTIKRDNRYWTVVNAPFSRFTEAMRSIKLAVDLDLKNAAKGCRVIGFTSSLPNEGKSTIVLALAQLISQTGKRVIVNPTTLTVAVNGQRFDVYIGVVDEEDGMLRVSVTEHSRQAHWRLNDRASLALAAERDVPRDDHLLDIRAVFNVDHAVDVDDFGAAGNQVNHAGRAIRNKGFAILELRPTFKGANTVVIDIVENSICRFERLREHEVRRVEVSAGAQVPIRIRCICLQEGERVIRGEFQVRLL